jgi:hypothetical protein
MAKEGRATDQMDRDGEGRPGTNQLPSWVSIVSRLGAHSLPGGSKTFVIALARTAGPQRQSARFISIDQPGRRPRDGALLWRQRRQGQAPG